MNLARVYGRLLSLSYFISDIKNGPWFEVFRSTGRMGSPLGPSERWLITPNGTALGSAEGHFTVLDVIHINAIWDGEINNPIKNKLY